MEDKTSSGATAVAENPSAGSTPSKKAAKSKTKAQRAKSSHPPTSEMVNSAIKDLKDRKGSSLQAIKKYIASTYMVDGEKLAPFIKRYLKTAVTSGAVVQTKGKGASGSFKLNAVKNPTETARTKKMRSAARKEAKKPAVEKKTVAKKVSAVKKPASPKKPAEKKAAAAKKTATKAAATKAKAASEPKSPSKAKKTAKAPAAKTKTPKPKKASTAKAVKSAGKK